MKNQDNSIQLDDFEPLIIFAALFLPGYLAQGAAVNQAIFNDPLFNVSFILTGCGQSLLIYYLVTRSKWRIARQFGFKRFLPVTVLKSILMCGGIFLSILPFILISMLGGSEASRIMENPVQWQIERYSMLPLIFVTCIVTGYREELFFRSYLIATTESYGFPAAVSVLISSGLFSLGHIYQGWMGFMGTFTIGVFLSCMFLWKRDLHLLAISHGLYNFITLFLSIGNM